MTSGLPFFRAPHWARIPKCKSNLLFILLSGLLGACITVRDIPSPARGSIDRPICSDGAMAQRNYLRKLRTQDGRRVEYSREDPVVGPEGHLLDPFVIKAEGALPWQGVMLGRLGEVEDPARSGDRPHRIFMDMYRPGCVEEGSPPGFRMSTPD